MRRTIATDSELKLQLTQELIRFRELDERKKAMYSSQEIITLTDGIAKYRQLVSEWQDSAEEIAHIYKKLHPYFPIGTCSNCGSVTTKILGSGRVHYACVACGEESIE